MMLADAPVVTDSRDLLDQAQQQTTLFDLIATMQDVAPDSDELITATVMDLLRTRRMRFLSDTDRLSDMIESAEAA